MALVPAASAQRFNGGAISGALDVAYTGAPGTTPLTVTGSALQTPENDRTLMQVEDGDGIGRLFLESNGSLTLLLDGGNGGTFQVGDGATPGATARLDTSKVAFFQAAAVGQQTVTGALSTVADPAAKAVLTSLLAAIVAFGLVTNGTT